MSKVIGRLLVVLAFGWAASVTALPIVTVDGRDWLQPVDFINLSWNDINSVCDDSTGVCSGTLASIDLTGYTWSDSDDLNALFNYFLPGNPMGPGPTTQILLPHKSFYPLLVAAGFLPTYSDVEGDFAIGGWLRTPCPNPPPDIPEWDGCLLSSRKLQGFAGIESRFAPENNYDYANTALPNEPDQSFVTRGGWFWREQVVDVPLPTTLPLLGMGLAVLAYSRRKRAIQG